MTPTRRRVLRALGATGAIAAAGCTSSDGDNDSNGSDPTINGSTPENGSDTDDGETASDPTSSTEAATQAIDLLRAGEYEAIYSRFPSAYQSSVTIAAIERIHLGLLAAGGEIQSTEVTDTGMSSGLQTVDLRLELERRPADVRISTTEEFELVGIGLVGEYERASYADPDSFQATEHTLEPDGCQLGATLTTPTDVDAVPGVVIVHGSGPSDRDATVAANKPYRDIAEGLASQGIAVLRYDKRTMACNVSPAEYTVDRVTVDDALHAISWLRDREAVASDDVTVLGHSLGAMLAPEIADRDGELAGAVGLAAPARPLTDAFLDQISHLASVTEHESPAYSQRRDQWENAAEQIATGNYDADESLMGYPGAFWTSLDGYDPVDRAESVATEQFYLQGERDYQVTVEGDFTQWQSTFGDSTAVSLSTYEDLNHAFLPGEGPSVPAAYGVSNQVEKTVVDDVAAWITD
ncbi:alpha/beta hydrolase [Salinarchaeum laminariae]|uniref:alpha/beta hydrolase n=1 Tax=Salinarchaeum laminariae TaxID=869888 RepID=UPI0020C02BA1|nr:alpha/beta fold hydrolase [Salinarchaeum laminariae]